MATWSPSAMSCPARRSWTRCCPPRAPSSCIDSRSPPAASLTRQTRCAALAHHADAAGDGAAVLEFAPRAARRAPSCAPPEAAEQYARTLRWAHQLPPREQAVLYEARSYECYLTGQMEAALEARRQAIDRWRADGEIARVGDNLRWQSRLSWWLGRRADAEAQSRESIAVLESAARARSSPGPSPTPPRSRCWPRGAPRRSPGACGPSSSPSASANAKCCAMRSTTSAPRATTSTAGPRGAGTGTQPGPGLRARARSPRRPRLRQPDSGLGVGPPARCGGEPARRTRLLRGARLRSHGGPISSVSRPHAGSGEATTMRPAARLRPCCAQPHAGRWGESSPWSSSGASSHGAASPEHDAARRGVGARHQHGRVAADGSGRGGAGGDGHGSPAIGRRHGAGRARSLRARRRPRAMNGQSASWGFWLWRAGALAAVSARRGRGRLHPADIGGDARRAAACWGDNGGTLRGRRRPRRAAAARTRCARPIGRSSGWGRNPDGRSRRPPGFARTGARSIVARRPRASTRANPAGLTGRELEVLRLVAEGLRRNAEIGGAFVRVGEDRRPSRVVAAGQAGGAEPHPGGRPGRGAAARRAAARRRALAKWGVLPMCGWRGGSVESTAVRAGNSFSRGRWSAAGLSACSGGRQRHPAGNRWHGHQQSATPTSMACAEGVRAMRRQHRGGRLLGAGRPGMARPGRRRVPGHRRRGARRRRQASATRRSPRPSASPRCRPARSTSSPRITTVTFQRDVQLGLEFPAIDW